MSPPEPERARAFLKRADADLAAVRALEDADPVPDEIVGFHAQQAAEKLLKAVLAGRGIEFPRTHSIRFLLDLLADHGLAPHELGREGARTGFSTTYRQSASRCGSRSTRTAANRPWNRCPTRPCRRLKRCAYDELRRCIAIERFARGVSSTRWKWFPIRQYAWQTSP